MINIQAKLKNSIFKPLDLGFIKRSKKIIRVANFLGEYFWHKHNQSEFFYVLSGEIKVLLKSKKSIKLKTGEFVEIRKGVWHCPKAKKRAVVLMIEDKAIKTIKYAK